MPKVDAHGPFAEEWIKMFGDISKDIEEVDISPAIALAKSVLPVPGAPIRRSPFGIFAPSFWNF